MAADLDEGIRSMRAAVLARLAERKKMYFDIGSLEVLVKTLPDEDVWFSILRSNAGVVGFCRRTLLRLRQIVIILRRADPAPKGVQLDSNLPDSRFRRD